MGRESEMKKDWQTLELCDRFFDSIEQNDYETLESCYAPEAVIWGTGAPLREFLHVDDLADAAVYLMRNYSSGDILNVGTG